MTYVPPNKLTMRIVPTTMGTWSDGRRPGASHYAITPGAGRGRGISGFGDGGDVLGGIWDAVGAAVGGAANYIRGTQTPPPTVVPQDTGIDTSTLLLLGALGLGGYFVYKKMKRR